MMFCLKRKTWTMTIEQAQHLRVVWQSKGFSSCQHPTSEREYYHSGEPTGLSVCLGCGEYLLGDLGSNPSTGDVR